jgi:hypothetical protein
VSDLEDSRLLPHDIGAEMAVLGAVLSWPAAVAEVAAALGPQDLYRPAHQIVLEAVTALHELSRPVDPITVRAELERRGQVAKIGGATYLHDLMASVTTVAGVGEHVRIVKERAVLRRQVEGLTRGLQLANAPGADPAAVEQAIGKLAETAPRDGGRLGQLRAALLDSSALDSIEPPRAVIDGLLYRDGLAWLYGKPATYKSFVALDWAGCVSTGLPWQEHETTQGAVLYLVAEGTAGLAKRVRAWEDYADCTMLAKFLPVAVQLLNPVDLAAFSALVAELAPVMVVIDTQARVTVGADENNTMEMGRLVAAADSIRAVCQACVLIVHHEPRGGENMRGSIALEGAATSLFRAERDGSRITLKNVRQRDVGEADDIVLHAVPRLESVVIQSNEAIGLAGFGHFLTDSEKAIMDTLLDCFLDSDASASTLMEMTKQSKSTFFHAINGLVSKGKVVKDGPKGRYRYGLPSGRVQLSPTESSPTGNPESKSPTPFKGLDSLGLNEPDDSAVAAS